MDPGFSVRGVVNLEEGCQHTISPTFQKRFYPLLPEWKSELLEMMSKDIADGVRPTEMKKRQETTTENIKTHSDTLTNQKNPQVIT